MMLDHCEKLDVEKFFKKPEKSPWDIYPQNWKSRGVDCRYDGAFVIWGAIQFEATPHLKQKYINPRTLINFLEDSWEAIGKIAPILTNPKPQTGILRQVHIKQKHIKEALEVGVDVGVFQKEGKVYRLVEKFSNNQNDRWNPEHFETGQMTMFNEPPEPDDFETREEFEEAWKQWELLQQGCSLVAEGAAQKAQLPQDINPSGQSKMTPTPQQSTESDSQTQCLSNKTLPPLATNLSEASQPQTSLSAAVHARISPLLAIAPESLEIAQVCFLSSSDSCKSNSLQCFYGRTLAQSYLVEGDKITSASLTRLHRWGMWGVGKLETATDTSLKTESASLLWVFTGDIRVTTPKPGLKSLAEIIGESSAIVYRAAGGDRIYTDQAPCLRSQKDAGTGAYKIREVCRTEDSARRASREYEGEGYLERPINATEAEQLMGWEVGSTATGINKEGDEITISQTQRIKMLGNGIIVGEIVDILTSIKPIISKQLESEIPDNLRFAYRQLRQRGMSHQEAIQLLA